MILVQQPGQVRPGIGGELGGLAAAADQLGEFVLLGRGEITQARLPRDDDLLAGCVGRRHAGDSVAGQAGLEARRNGAQDLAQLGPQVRSGLRRVVRAAERVRAGAVRRPFADQVQVSGQGPGIDRLEHVVLQHEVAGVGPVVRNLAGVVIAHHVRRAGREAYRRDRPGGAAAAVQQVLRRGHEPVHLAAVDVRPLGREAVRGAAVDQARVVVRLVAPVRARIRHADGELAVLDRQAICSRVGAEERVERPVLLHDDDHVTDLADPARRGRRPRGRCRRLAGAGGQAHGHRHQSGRRQPWTPGSCRVPQCSALQLGYLVVSLAVWRSHVNIAKTIQIGNTM